MSNVAVIGGSGFIGKHLLELLTKKGITIRALSHSDTSKAYFDANRIDYFQGDIYNTGSLRQLCKDVAVLVILTHLDNLPSNNLIKNIVQICVKGGVKRIIYCSSAVIVGDVKEDVITESTICNPVNSYEKHKLIVERLLTEECKNKIQLAILRPTAVFGKGGKNLIKLANSILYGNKIVNYIKSSMNQDRKMHLVYIRNVTEALYFLIISKENFSSEIFIISDDDCMSNNYRDVELLLTKHLLGVDKLVPRILIPKIVLKLILFIKYKRSVNTKRIYSSKKIESRGYEKPVDFLFGLKAFSDWYKHK